MASNDHTVYLRQGNVGTPAEPNKNPSAAQSQTNQGGNSPIGTAVTATVFIQAGKQVMGSVIGNIGFATGNYELQEQAETIVSLAGVGIGLYVAPIPTAIALGIKVGFDSYANGIKRNRMINKQQQAQVLTGKIATNGGRWL